MIYQLHYSPNFHRFNVLDKSIISFCNIEKKIYILCLSISRYLWTFTNSNSFYDIYTIFVILIVR